MRELDSSVKVQNVFLEFIAKKQSRGHESQRFQSLTSPSILFEYFSKFDLWNFSIT